MISVTRATDMVSSFECELMLYIVLANPMPRPSPKISLRLPRRNNVLRKLREIFSRELMQKSSVSRLVGGDNCYQFFRC